MSEKTDRIIRELGFTPGPPAPVLGESKAKKTKVSQPVMLNDVQGRDLFQTPNYAVDLLVPFIPKQIRWIWEPACGDGKIVRALYDSKDRPLVCYQSDIRQSSIIPNNIGNFLTGPPPMLFDTESWAIVTNPPFSLKQKFYEKCREHGVPFALLIPADYSGWIIRACQDGAEKIVPTRRIDYITPNILTRIHEGEVYEIWLRDVRKKKDEISLLSVKQFHPGAWKKILELHLETHNYSNISDVPTELLWKYSSSDFHSMWLTWGFNLGRTETFVELSIKDKKENI